MKNIDNDIEQQKQDLKNQIDALLKRNPEPVPFAIEAIHLALLSNVVQIDNNAILLEAKKRLELW